MGVPVHDGNANSGGSVQITGTAINTLEAFREVSATQRDEIANHFALLKEAVSISERAALVQFDDRV